MMMVNIINRHIHRWFCCYFYYPCLHVLVFPYMYVSVFAFSALTLLVEHQEGHLACKILEWWGAGIVICLERDADLHMAQLMPLPLTVSCFSKIQIGSTFLVLAHPGSPRKGLLNGCVCVCVRVCLCICLCMSLGSPSCSIDQAWHVHRQHWHSCHSQTAWCCYPGSLSSELSSTLCIAALVTLIPNPNTGLFVKCPKNSCPFCIFFSIAQHTERVLLCQTKMPFLGRTLCIA